MASVANYIWFFKKNYNDNNKIIIINKCWPRQIDSTSLFC